MQTVCVLCEVGNEFVCSHLLLMCTVGNVTMCWLYGLIGDVN